MPLSIEPALRPASLLPAIEHLFELSGPKILALQKRWQPSRGSPVFTAAGKYTARGWTEWTQGFQFGSALLQFDATADEQFLEIGKEGTIGAMAAHVSHVGVHDHGFNTMSTYGNLRRFMREGRIQQNDCEQQFYELAIKVSGAIQAARWTDLPSETGFIYSFNGPHSLFVDTLRSLRVLAAAHQLGHVLMGERDRRINLLERLIQHGETTARFSIYYGENRDLYDIRGRTAHESIFNTNDGSYRCPGSQQGYSPFSTWTRGLAWALLGYAEQLEFLAAQRGELVARASEAFMRAALATADYYLQIACTDGVPFWDTAAPNLHHIPESARCPSDPFNTWEPVDSSAAVIAAQGFLRLGKLLLTSVKTRRSGKRYLQAGLTIARTLLNPPYLSEDPRHEGLLLHSVYHWPNRWDYVHKNQQVPNQESSQWGDYHLRELAILIRRLAIGETYPTFFAY